MATIKEVAELAGVSVATVSRVLNNSDSVLPTTRDKVLEAMEQLQYQPNLLARHLRCSETKLILVIIPSIANLFFSEVVKGMQDAARTYGYNILLCATENDAERLQVYINLLKSRQADGAIFVSTIIDDKTLTEIADSYPVVQCSEYKEGLNISYVTIDNRLAAYHGVQHLIKIGRRRIAFINGREDHLSTRLRLEGYKQALSDYKIEYCEELVRNGLYGIKSGHRIMRQLLDLKEPPDGVLASSDMMAIGAIKVAKQMGFQVPGDIAVVSFDNTRSASIFEPSITSIAQPMYDLGQCSVEILIKKINSQDKYEEKLVLEHELVIRQSTIG
ncbi:MAG: LacI family transcriptional regulator, repressor for deo operon, udp, cdd, tsx, nupC, and nupG [Petroclostridium sp.]|jgi:DNA-binding LacI/PurR family transcriptional regulator|uniref:LacI family DNA-binding transcriptional regulator n=1 Tax=Petroclostridium xylanilyticum TaxID=1792311 RepID=UPI000B9862D4|nr:LacI family DNA-binding transcriptional regulator [Petroclostridium xylanilyticum]MBZ4645929.1 PurR8 [Clostridia bacterium]MDK2811482.1 LacI family transcriptional regulator, repressor for deo operon, udp, cdd, tsx, nupC, and nupG [Petroclostridium sp.]